jgi:hypothetical protein
MHVAKAGAKSRLSFYQKLSEPLASNRRWRNKDMYLRGGSDRVGEAQERGKSVRRRLGRSRVESNLIVCAGDYWVRTFEQAQPNPASRYIILEPWGVDHRYTHMVCLDQPIDPPGLPGDEARLPCGLGT